MKRAKKAYSMSAVLIIACALAAAKDSKRIADAPHTGGDLNSGGQKHVQLALGQPSLGPGYVIGVDDVLGINRVA